MLFFVGLCLGGITGLLLGLSVSPVVGSIVGAILALSISFFGLEEKARTGQARFASGQILSFGMGLVASMILGVWMRTHQWLSPSPAAQVRFWKDAGLSDAQAKDLMIFERTGLKPVAAQGETSRPLVQTTGLFAGVSVTDCGPLERTRFSSAADRYKAMADLGEPWSGLGGLDGNLSTPQLERLTEAVWQIRCGESAE